MAADDRPIFLPGMVPRNFAAIMPAFTMNRTPEATQLPHENYWIKPRWDIRTEARLHALGAGEVLVIGRIGFAFR